MKRLRWYDFISINLFWLALNIRNNAIGAIFMPYLVDQFANPDLRNTALGFLRTSGLVIAMLAQPVFGILSDRNTSRFGRRRPYIFGGTLLDLFFLALITIVSGYWALVVVLMFQQFSANISHGALQGLIPDLVPEDQRGRASAVKSIFELIPIILLGLTVSKMVGAGHFDLGVFAVGVAMLIIMLFTMYLVKEKPITKTPDTPLTPALVRVLGMLAGIFIGAAIGILAGFLLGGLIFLIAWPMAGQQTAINIGVSFGGITAMVVAVVAGVWAGTLVTIGKQVRKQPSFTWWVVNRLMFLAAITSIQGIALYFLMFAFNVNRDDGTSMNGTLMFVVGLCTLISALPSGWLSDRIGQKRLVAIGGGLATVGTVVLLVTVWIPNMALIYGGGIILGISTGLWMTTNWALGTRLVPSQEAGRYLGISNLAGAGAGMIGAGMAGPVADFLNFRIPGLGYFAIFSGYAVLFLMSIVTLRWIRLDHNESEICE